MGLRQNWGHASKQGGVLSWCLTRTMANGLESYPVTSQKVGQAWAWQFCVD